MAPRVNRTNIFKKIDHGLQIWCINSTEPKDIDSNQEPTVIPGKNCVISPGM